MKRLFAVLVMVSLGIATFANPVDVTTAQAVSTKFMIANTEMKGDLNSQLVYTYVSEAGNTCLYAMNVGTNGFVIVAADDRSTPILGYSTEGSFDISSIAPAMDEYLKGFVEQIDYAIENDIPASDEIVQQWALVKATGNITASKNTNTVDPLLSLTWNQNYPYNLYCPIDAGGPGGHVYVGCTSTAMAMIMKYWGYPVHGIGSKTYTPSGYPQQSVNFSTAHYEYDIMPDNITIDSSMEQITAVAYFMYHCAVSLGTSFGPGGSNAYPSDVPGVMKNNFAYSTETAGKNKNSYSTSAWIALLKGDLDLGRPIHYSGWNSYGGGGHSFVCDGYDESDYFHFNWGWSGSGDGFFALGALYVGNYDFSYNNYAVMYAHPISYTVSATASPSAGGTTLVGDGSTDSFYKFSTVTVTATPNTGYEFVKWTKSNGTTVSTEQEYSFELTTNTSLVAHFQVSTVTYEVTATVTPNGAGTVTGTGTYDEGATAVLIATANSGYSFQHWLNPDGSVASNASTYSFVVTGNVNLTAAFTVLPTEINIMSVGNYLGDIGTTITVGVSLDNESQVAGFQFDLTLPSSVTYVANSLVKSSRLFPQHILIGQVVSGNILRVLCYSMPGTNISGNSGEIVTFSLNLVGPGGIYSLPLSNTAISDIMGHTSYPQTVDGSLIILEQGQTTYEITATANPAIAGSVSGAGTYIEGTTATLTATPSEGYFFVNWTENGTEVCTTPVYSFVVNGDRTLVANFILAPVFYNVTADVTPAGTGTVSGTGSYIEGTTATLTATANEGYYFLQWLNENGDIVSSESTYSFIVTRDINLTAVFAEIPPEINIMSIGDYVGNIGTTITVGVNLENESDVAGFQFDLTLPSSVTYVAGSLAKSSRLYPQHIIMGQIVGGNILRVLCYSMPGTNISGNSGEIVHFDLNLVGETGTYALPLSNAILSNINGTAFNSIVVNGSITIIGQEQTTYEITATANPAIGGSISGTGTYIEGTTAILTATPSNGYYFYDWTENGAEVCLTPVYSFVVDSDRTLVANFVIAPVYYTITASAAPAAGGTVTGAGTYLEGTTATLTATANSNYLFTNWTENGVTVSSSATYSFVVDSDRTLVANFVEMPPTINIMSIGDYTCALNSPVTIGVNLDNEDEIAGFQFDINIPEGMTYVANSVVKTNRLLPQHILQAEMMGDNLLRVLCFSMPSANILGNSGDIITFQLVGNVPGTYPIDLSEIVLSDISGNSPYVIGYSGTVTVLDMQAFDVTTTAMPAAGGTVTGAGSYPANTEVTITATPNTGYDFEYWSESGQTISTNPIYTFVIVKDMDFVAHFALQTFNVTLTANPVAGGTLTGAGTYNYGQTATLTATPAQHYNFVNWTDAQTGQVYGTSTTLTLLVTHDYDIVANFQLKSYTVTASSSYGGTITGAGTYVYGTTVTMTATPYLHYNFVSWTENGQLISENASFSFVITSNRNFYATFAIQTFDVTVTINPANSGIVTGAGTYDYNTNATLTATPALHYNFVNWTDAATGQVYGTATTLTLLVTQDYDIVANFALQTFDVTLTANPVDGGTVTGAGTYNYGENAILTATPAQHYNFVNWTDAQTGQVYGTSTTLTLLVTHDYDIVANFQLKSYTVTASSSYGGTISGAGTYVYGTTVTMTATPYLHYNFVSWTENGQLISENASFSFVITSNRNFYATFAIETFDVTVTVNPANSGTVTGAGTYDYNTYATLTATPAEHYNFVNWTDAVTGQVYGNAAVLSLLVTQDYDIVANFILETLTVNITVQPANGGTVTGAGNYFYGTTVTLTAEPNVALDFAFKGWYENNVLLSSALEYSFIVMQNHNIVAKFIRPGDVTDDGLVDIRDVTATVAYIMEQNPPVFDFDNGDLNGDGAIDMRDLMAIINIIFSKKVTVCEGTAGNAVYTIENGVLYLETPVEIGAFMLKFDSEVTVSETLDGFDVAADNVADGDFMVIAYSMSGKTLKPGKYALMTVEKAKVTGYSIATPEACDVNLIDGSILGIGDETVAANVYPNPTDGMITVEAENMSEIVISNMMGQIVGRYTDINGSSANIDMNGYEKGTYLVRIITDSSVIVRNVVKM